LHNLGFGLGHLMERNWVDSVFIIYHVTVGAVTRLASHSKQQILKFSLKIAFLNTPITHCSNYLHT